MKHVPVGQLVLSETEVNSYEPTARYYTQYTVLYVQVTVDDDKQTQSLISPNTSRQTAQLSIWWESSRLQTCARLAGGL